jgi:hypothetical protein
MKNYKNIIRDLSFILGAAILCSSCTKGFKELNTNPNTSEFALPQALLAPALHGVVSANMNRSQRVNNELMQVTVNMGDTEGKIFRYEIRPSEADYLWNAWYIELTNFKDIYKGAIDLANPSYQAVSLICQAYTYSLLTDTYGDIPFSESNQGKDKIYTPKFDQQKDIYPALFEMLEQANELLKPADAATNGITGASDPIFNGSRDKWRRFGNSLYLRLLLRISAKTEFDAPAKIKEIVDTKASTYPIMRNNDDSAVLRWTGTAPYVSPFATWRDGDWRGPKLASFFVDNLSERSDPRLQTWATLFEGDYAGVPSGYPPGQAPQEKSSFPLSLRGEPRLGNILNYSELQFILAEAAVKGWATAKTAREYYETGSTSGITFWGYAVPNNYLTFEKVRWNENYDFDEKMELIHIQKYYSMFFTDLQQWFEYRRTGHPEIPIGAGVGNGGKMPARLMYPVYVQAANGVNYREAVAVQGPDNINTLVWWQRP